MPALCSHAMGTVHAFVEPVLVAARMRLCSADHSDSETMPPASTGCSQLVQREGVCFLLLVVPEEVFATRLPSR